MAKTLPAHISNNIHKQGYKPRIGIICEGLHRAYSNYGSFNVQM